MKYTLNLSFEPYELYISPQVQEESNKSPPYLLVLQKNKREGEEEAMRRINKKCSFKGIGENRPPPKLNLGYWKWLKLGSCAYISKGIPLQIHKKNGDFKSKFCKKITQKTSRKHLTF